MLLLCQILEGQVRITSMQPVMRFVNHMRGTLAHRYWRALAYADYAHRETHSYDFVVESFKGWRIDKAAITVEVSWVSDNAQATDGGKGGG